MMENTTKHAGSLQLLAEQLSLDYVNTVDERLSDNPFDHLASYADLVAWSQHAGAVSEAQAQTLLVEASRRPEDAAATLQRAVTLREAIYRLFWAVSAGQRPRPTDLEILNQELSWAMAQARIIPRDGGYSWDWSDDQSSLDRMLWPIVHSAADLLASDDLGRVRKCAADDCGWLFVDTSKNGSRRWCSMESCGNRAKARRHYERTARATPEEPQRRAK